MHPARTRTVEKKVYFYSVRVNGALVRDTAAFDFARLFGQINRMPYTVAGRYLAEGPDVVTCFVDAARTIRFGRIRRSNLPPIVNGAAINPIVVPPDGGLFECTHLMYFEHGIIGAEFNFYAPRATRLSEYLREKSGLQDVELLPILRQDPEQALRRYQAIYSATFKIATALAPVLRNQGAGLIAAIAEAGREEGIELVDVTLSMGRGREAALNRTVFDNVLSLLRLPNVREEVGKLKVGNGARNLNR